MQGMLFWPCTFWSQDRTIIESMMADITEHPGSNAKEAAFLHSAPWHACWGISAFEH